MSRVNAGTPEDGAGEPPKAVLLMDPSQFEGVWGPDERATLAHHVHLVGRPARTLPTAGRTVLDDVEVLITGWGAQTLDRDLIDRVPNLRVVVHAAGSVRTLGTPDFWARQIPVLSAVDANTRPTAEFAAAEIVYALKKGWQTSRHLARTRDWNDRSIPIPGLNGSVVGLVSLGRVGRYVAERLALIGSIRVIAFDPHARAEDVADIGVELTSLEDVFGLADVVSIHTPWIPETTGLITADLLRSMKHGATLINTARGAVIDERGLIDVLLDRPDLFAALDVTYPEPPAADSTLFTLPNVALTPHIAGSAGSERWALARSVLEQLERYLDGHPVRAVGRDDRHSVVPGHGRPRDPLGATV